MKLADRSWPLLSRLMRVHAIVYRASGGVIGHRLPGWRQMLLLDHVGAKSHVVPPVVLEPRWHVPSCGYSDDRCGSSRWGERHGG
jgi:hypothetical protein